MLVRYRVGVLLPDHPLDAVRERPVLTMCWHVNRTLKWGNCKERSCVLHLVYEYETAPKNDPGTA